MEPWRAADAHNGGVKAQEGAVEVYGPMVTNLHHF
jgi:hypothetical protein